MTLDDRLKEYGITVFDTNGNRRNVVDIMSDVTDRYHKLNRDNQKNMATEFAKSRYNNGGYIE